MPAKFPASKAAFHRPPPGDPLRQLLLALTLAGCNSDRLTSSGAIARTPSLIQEPICMRVVGGTAYISMVTVKTFDENVSKVGDKGVFWVRDGGKDGEDVGYGGPAFFWDPTNAICTSTPPQLPEVPVANGNFIVR